MAEFFTKLADRFKALPRAQQVGLVVGAGVFTLVTRYLGFRIRESQHKFNKYTLNIDALDGLDLTGKIAVVTGANNGLGLETARELVRQGCRVIMACRNIEKGNAAKNNILNSLNLNENSQQIEVMALDLSSLQSVTDFSKAFNSKNLKIDYLINNAGIMALPDYRTSKEGYELQFATNHLGHFLLTHLLMPSLLKKSDTPSDRLPRVINLSSVAHRRPYDYNWTLNLFEDCKKERTFMSNSYKGQYNAWENYGISKVSNILFARELQKRFNSELISVSCHPGGVQTGLSKHLTPKDILRFLWALISSPTFYYTHMKSIEQGAACTLRCVSLSDNEIEKGEYYANCRVGKESGQLMSIGKESLYDGGKMAETLWELSEILVTEKGFSLTP